MAKIQMTPHVQEWTKWIRQFEHLRQASGLVEKEQVSQIHTLVCMMGDEAEDILSSFRPTEEQGKSYATVIKKFKHYFVKRRNIIFKQAKFDRCQQEEGKPVDDYIMDLCCLASHCNYGYTPRRTKS